MNKQFRCGLVVGKFCPLHHGHEFLIERALYSCDEVIIISYTKPEFARCDRNSRERWITHLFPTVISLVIDDALLERLCKVRDIPIPMSVPHNDAPDAEHRQFVAWLCMTILGKAIDAVFTSEDYGEGFVDALTTCFQLNANSLSKVRHVCVDEKRETVPISGTKIRASPHQYRRFLSSYVYASFVERICILGGESSGKTTLAQAMATHFDTTWVPEYGRELWELKNGQLLFEDMLKIGRIQVERELALSLSANQFLICDTSPLTTLFYSKEMFGVADPALERLATRQYDHTFLCVPDFGFVQDKTRRDQEFSLRQHSWYLAVLAARNIAFSLIEGKPDERLSTVAQILIDGH